ncbi:MAG: peptidylprolyl isomerase [Bacteroidota bacterium]
MDFISLFAQVVSILGKCPRYFCYLFIGVSLIACEEKSPETKVPTEKADVILHTDLGDIHVKLFDETPRHKANFLKLARRGFFDSLSFNRIIYDFMIQSGDPRYRNGGIDTSQEAGPGYELEAEFREEFVHTRGMIGAARKPDEENEERKSAGSQFYIVTGKTVKAAVLDTMETVGTGFRRGNLYTKFQQSLADSSFSGSFQDFLQKEDFTDFSYPIKQKQLYMQLGGAPHLDFTYTLFGKVLEGMDIVMDISKMPTNSYNVPKDTIRILSAEVL